jgi:hypothetical protein
VLLSDDFLDTHCFRMVRAEKDRPGAVGLGFEPVKGRRVPEIKGTLWVDRGSAELRMLDYEYVNVPSAVRTPGLGGRSEFARLATGDWIIKDWYIRLPDRVDRQRRPGARIEVRARHGGGIHRRWRPLRAPLGCECTRRRCRRAHEQRNQR